MTFGVDISKYQPASAMDGWDFVILNVKDPGFADKARHAIDIGIPWDVYWFLNDNGVYESGGDAFAKTQALVNRANLPGRAPGYWLDYEQAGVVASQVHEWFAAADQAGVQSGWYTYLYVINGEGNHAPGRPLWLAYYPGNNDGSYNDAMSTTARNLNAEIHQYSSGGNLDRNVVLDDAFWAEWTGDDMTEAEVEQIIDRWLNTPQGLERFGVLMDKYRLAIDMNVDRWLNEDTPFGPRFKQLLDKYSD